MNHHCSATPSSTRRHFTPASPISRSGPSPARSTGSHHRSRGGRGPRRSRAAVRRPRLEVADVFHRHGADWRRANAGHVSLGQLQVMSAIEQCRSAALGGHVERCEDCGHSRIAYNSCRNRHCPKCQGAAAQDWLAAREADLLPVGYFHVVFTLPAEISPIAYQNKAIVYDLLFRTAAETLLTIAPTGQARGLKAHDPKHLGARIGATAVLHSWGSTMTHHPHVHMIVPGGGISLDGTRWVRCKPGFLLPVPVLSRLFRRLFLTALADAHAAGRLAFFGEIEGLRRRAAFDAHLAPLTRKKWFVYARPPFSGREAVLAYLARYTHRVAISNSRLVALDERGVTFRYKDYRRNGQARYCTMTLSADEFIRRFLLHVLPKGFHRIRHYGLLASATCKANIARARELIADTCRSVYRAIGSVGWIADLPQSRGDRLGRAGIGRSSPDEFEAQIIPGSAACPRGRIAAPPGERGCPTRAGRSRAVCTKRKISAKCETPHTEPRIHGLPCIVGLWRPTGAPNVRFDL